MFTKPGAQPNQSLIDGIRTLQALAIASEPIGCRPLARQLHLDVTKVNRLLRTLASLGIARQTANRKYTAGPGMHVLAAQSLFATGFVARALPALESLRRFGLTVAMGVLWNGNVSYLYHAPPGIDSSRAMSRIGVLPATTTGIGMALLAQLTDDQIREIYEGEEIPGYPLGVEPLLAAIDVIRNAEFARVLVSPEEDRHTIAIPVGEPTFAAIAITGWIPESNTAEIVAALRAAGSEIEQA